MPNTYVSRLRLLSAVFLLVTAGGLQAQLSSTCSGGNDNGNFSISIDTVATNIGVLTDLTGAQIDLTGFSTYRLYLQCESSNDLLQAVGGDSNVPVTISTTTSFYQAQFGSAIESNPGLIAVYPQVEYDSYVTIGLFETAVAADGEAATSLTEDNAVFPVSIGFENGNDLIIDSFTGSSWYVADAEAASNCIAGDDLKVLFAQVTTDGDIDGDVQFQVYRNGLQQAENCLRPYLPINPLNQPGCTDPAACNYDASAFVDNGSCDFCSCADTTLFSTVSFPNDSLSQYSLDIDVYANHDTTGFPELAGMKTYRMYINMAEANDKLTAVYGNDETPLDIQSTAPFYQDALGAVTPNSILEFYFDIFPTVVYDSWVTIGIDRAPQDFGTGYSDVFTASDPNQSTTWMADFDPGAGVSGSNILANTNVGGIWSVTNPTVQNGVPDENQRVLIGQFTTGGIITGSIAVQIIPETLPADDDEYRLTFEFTTDNLGDLNVSVNGSPVNEEECGCLSDSDADGICDSSDNCSDISACNFDSPENDTCQTLDILGVCGGGCTADTDNDEICDDIDPCVGTVDECGVCNGEGAVFECGCLPLLPSWCDCNGNTLDALGVCGGDCAADDNNNNICDADEVTGCQDDTACNYNAAANMPGACAYASGCNTCSGETDGTGIVVDNDSDDDGVCDANEVSGCTDNTACNYEDTATESDDSCLYEDALGECGGICLSDLDNDGICDNDDACVGLYDALGICNGTCPADLDNDDICDTEDPCVGDYDVLGICNGDCTADEDEDGICDDVDPCVGSLDALNVCNGDCPADVDEDGVCDNAEIFGCTDENACNYNSIATEEDSSCAYLDVLDECGGSCTADLDNDGICDDVDACVGSYDALGDCNGGCTADIDDDGVCDDEDPCVGTPDALGVCNGDCPSDADQDGVCDNAEILGCDDTAACNYDPVATENDGSCTTLDALDECGGDCTADADNDGICDDVDSCIGALDAIGVCNGDCTADIDGDGVCDSSELLGCTDENACNYNVNATEEDGSCTVEDAIGVCGGDCPCDQNNNGICDGEELACPDFNDNGICDGAEIFGCTYSGACNYQEEATVDDGSCTYTLPGFDCEGNDLNTSELFYGCTYEAAINYSAAADIDNGSCIFLDAITDIGPCYFDITNDGVVNTPDLLILLQYWEATCDE